MIIIAASVKMALARTLNFVILPILRQDIFLNENQHMIP